MKGDGCEVSNTSDAISSEVFDLFRSDLPRLQTVSNGKLRQLVHRVFVARESLFVRGGHDLPVDEEGR